MIDKTVADAVNEWVAGFNSIPRGMVETLMKTDPDAWSEITVPTRGDRVYIYNFPNETAEDTRRRGDIAAYLGDKTYRVVLDDGKGILVNQDDFEVECDDYLPMWGWMWSFGDSVDNYWLEKLDGIRLMSECGFRIYEHDEWGYFFGIDGCGYSFMEQHWEPLYKARGLQWHDPVAEKET